MRLVITCTGEGPPPPEGEEGEGRLQHALHHAQGRAKELQTQVCTPDLLGQGQGGQGICLVLSLRAFTHMGECSSALLWGVLQCPPVTWGSAPVPSAIHGNVGLQDADRPGGFSILQVHVSFCGSVEVHTRGQWLVCYGPLTDMWASEMAWVAWGCSSQPHIS